MTKTEIDKKIYEERGKLRSLTYECRKKCNERFDVFSYCEGCETRQSIEDTESRIRILEKKLKLKK